VSLDRFPYFYRVGPNENIRNLVRHKLLQNNNWKRVGLLSSSGIHSKVYDHYVSVNIVVSLQCIGC